MSIIGILSPERPFGIQTTTKKNVISINHVPGKFRLSIETVTHAD